MIQVKEYRNEADNADVVEMVLSDLEFMRFTIADDDGSVVLETDRKPTKRPTKFDAAMDGMESLLLALVSRFGTEINAADFIDSVEESLDAIVNNYGD